MGGKKGGDKRNKENEDLHTRESRHEGEEIQKLKGVDTKRTRKQDNTVDKEIKSNIQTVETLVRRDKL